MLEAEKIAKNLTVKEYADLEEVFADLKLGNNENLIKNQCEILWFLIGFFFLHLFCKISIIIVAK